MDYKLCYVLISFVPNSRLPKSELTPTYRNKVIPHTQPRGLILQCLLKRVVKRMERGERNIGFNASIVLRRDADDVDRRNQRRRLWLFLFHPLVLFPFEMFKQRCLRLQFVDTQRLAQMQNGTEVISYSIHNNTNDLFEVGEYNLRKFEKQSWKTKDCGELKLFIYKKKCQQKTSI